VVVFLGNRAYKLKKRPTLSPTGPPERVLDRALSLVCAGRRYQ